MPRRASYIASKNLGSRNPFLLLEGGDAIRGKEPADSIAAEFYFEALARLGYRALGLGERDFLLGQEFLRDLGRRKGIDLLCANLHEAGTDKLFGRATVTMRAGGGTVLGRFVGGVRVGLTSVLWPEETRRISPSRPGDRELIIRDPVSATRASVRDLRAHSDVIIVIAHTGIDAAREIARLVNGIDIVFVAHEDYAPKEPKFEGRTMVLAVPSKGRALGVVEAALTDQRHVRSTAARSVILDEAYPDDESMAFLVDEYKAALDAAGLRPPPDVEEGDPPTDSLRAGRDRVSS